MVHSTENWSIVCLTVLCTDIKLHILVFGEVHKIFWAFGGMKQIQHYEDLVKCTKVIYDKKYITNVNV